MAKYYGDNSYGHGRFIVSIEPDDQVLTQYGNVESRHHLDVQEILKGSAISDDGKDFIKRNIISYPTTPILPLLNSLDGDHRYHYDISDYVNSGDLYSIAGCLYTNQIQETLDDGGYVNPQCLAIYNQVYKYHSDQRVGLTADYYSPDYYWDVFEDFIESIYPKMESHLFGKITDHKGYLWMFCLEVAYELIDWIKSISPDFYLHYQIALESNCNMRIRYYRDYAEILLVSENEHTTLSPKFNRGNRNETTSRQPYHPRLRYGYGNP